MFKNPETIELIHPIELSEDFEATVAAPYLRNLYKELSVDPVKGISCPAFLSVNFCFSPYSSSPLSLDHDLARTSWGTSFRRL